MPRVRSSGSGVELRLSRLEADLLRRITEEMDGILNRSSVPDPVSRRLFPPAYEDETDARAYRELVGDDLERHKRAALESVVTALGEGGRIAATLDYTAVQDWLVALTDMRLALGTRLGVEEETMGREPDHDDPDAPQLAVLHWLGWLQELLVDNAPPLPDERMDT